MAIGDARIESEPELINVGLPDILERFEAAKDGALPGLLTGFRDLDAVLGGLHPGHLVILAARPSIGKSSLAAGIAGNVAAAGHPVAIFSLEMGGDETRERLLCSKARVSLHRARQGELTEQEWEKLVGAASVLYDLPLYIDPHATASPLELRAKSRRVKRAAGGLGLVVVDYLQLMAMRGFDTREREIAAISRSLKQLAVDLHVPVLAVSQLNRAVEARSDKRPQLSDLRESGSLEQDADVVVFIYRDEYYDPATEAKGVAEIHVAKHRSGPTGRVELSFISDWTLFADMAPDVETV